MEKLITFEDEIVSDVIQELEPQEIDRRICEDIDNLTEENNQIWSSPDHDRREYVHSFFQYPAMMVPVVQKKIIEILVANKNSILNVLDPFMGSGTSLVACMENGLNCFGQDINPLALLVAKTRTGPFYFNAINRKKSDFFDAIDADTSNRIEANFKGLKKWFKDDVARELSKIVRAIRNEDTLAIRRFYWVILAETVRLSSNDRTSTFKLHARHKDDIAKRDISPIELFKKHFENCLDDINDHSQLLLTSNKLSKGSYIGDITLNLIDSKRKIYTPGRENYFDLLVTSPPYGDNKTTVTYGQHSYLPLQWIDLEDIHKQASIDYLSTTSEIDSRGLGGKLKNISEDNLEELFNISNAFRTLYNRLKKKDPEKLKKVVNFFYDINVSIGNIHKSMKMDSYQVWTIGNRTVSGLEIKNDEIITDFIESQGAILIKEISREILNKRMAKRNSSSSLMTFEDILIFRKIG